MMTPAATASPATALLADLKPSPDGRCLLAPVPRDIEFIMSGPRFASLCSVRTLRSVRQYVNSVHEVCRFESSF